MAEFKELMKQRNRMCRSFLQESGLHDCCRCPIYSKNTQSMWDCNQYAAKNPEEFEDIILVWAEEHPYKTNADKFKEVFGIELLDNDCAGINCPKDCGYCSECKYDGFWSQEYKEPKRSKE